MADPWTEEDREEVVRYDSESEERVTSDGQRRISTVDEEGAEFVWKEQ